MNATESMNRENLKRKWLPWGAMNLMREGTEYKNIYGLLDWSRIPGVTSYDGEVKGFPLEGGAYLESDSQFAGGASDGEYGMAAYDYKWDGVSARKTWFFTPGGVYCMGSAITGPKEKSLLTCVNQCFSSGEVLASEGKKAYPVEGEKRADIRWIWHGGFGYFFPGEKDMAVKHSVQKGSWYDINTSQSKEPVEGKVFSAWINHSSEGTDGYEYAVVPSRELSVFKKWLKKNPFTVIARTGDIHAVYLKDKDLGAVAFFKPGKVELKKGWEISCDSPCIILVKFNYKGHLNISVADPSKKLSKLNLIVSRKLNGENVTNEASGNSIITFGLPSGDDAGKTIVRDFTL
jgi:chondroitin AC lyase